MTGSDLPADRPSAGPDPEGAPPDTPSADALGGNVAGADGGPTGSSPLGHPPTGSASGVGDDPSAISAEVVEGGGGLGDVLADAASVVEGDIVALASERDEMRALAQRLQADFENFKKRVSKQQSDSVERAADGLVQKLLPAVEAADLALVHDATGEAKQLATLLIESFEKEGLEVLRPAVGASFDPNEHDAVMHEPGDDGEPVIAEVFRAGYRWKGRLLQPAMVKVKD